MRTAIWYFDFVSPFAYICLHRLKELPAGPVDRVPAGAVRGNPEPLGAEGPAELPTKRRYTYRWSHWWAHSLGLPLRYPAAHPFNPLHHLRLAIACGSKPEAIRTIFDAIWTTGADASDRRDLPLFARKLGVAGNLAHRKQKTSFEKTRTRPCSAACSACRPSRWTANSSGAPIRSNS